MSSHIKVKKYQHLVFNYKGIIIQSNETLFSNEDMYAKEATDIIEFFRNIFPHISQELKTQKTITFKALDVPSNILPGIYDFIFSVKADTLDVVKPLVECWIIERTDFYEDAQQFQQNNREEALSVV